MNYVNKNLPAKSERKVKKLRKEIYAIERYCAFMTSLEDVQYDASVLLSRKVQCENKIVQIYANAEENLR